MRTPPILPEGTERYGHEKTKKTRRTDGAGF